MAETLNHVAFESRRPRLPAPVRNVLSNWVGFVFTAAVNFFLSPFVVHHLGNSAYGVWVLLGSLTGYLGLLDLGVRGAVTRYVAKFYAQSKHEEVSRVTSSALAIFIAAGLLALLVSLVLALFAVRFFNIPEEYQSTARFVLLLAGTNIAVSLVSGVFGGILVGLQRFDLSNAIEVLQTGLRTVVIVIALYAGKGLIALAFIQLIFSLASGLAYAWMSLRLYPQLRVRVGLLDRQHVALIFSFSAYSFLLQISGYLIFYTDSVVIGAFLPVSAVTFFAIAGNLMNYVRAVLSGITTVVSPLASSLEAQTGDAAVRQTLLRSGRYATMALAPILVTFMVRGETFINLWMGPSYGGLSGQVLWILSLAMLFAAGNYVAGATMIGIGRHKGLVPVGLAEAIANVTLSIALVRTWGVVGVAWGTALPDLATSFFVWALYVRRTLGVPVREYLASIWLRPGAGVLFFGLATYAMERLWPAGNLLVFFVQVALALPLALPGYWYICLTPGERQALATKLPDRRKPRPMETR